MISTHKAKTKLHNQSSPRLKLKDQTYEQARTTVPSVATVHAMRCITPSTGKRKHKTKTQPQSNHLLLAEVVNMLSAVTLLAVKLDLDFTLLNLFLEHIELGLHVARLPWWKTRVKDGVHLLEGASLGLVGHKEHVDERATIKGAENQVHFPVDGAEKWGDGKGKGAVPGPVGACGDGDGEGTNTEWEDFGRVGPGNRSPRDGEGGDKKIGAGNDSLGLTLLVDQNPGNGVTLDRVWLTVGSLERPRNEEPDHHGEGAEEEGWTTSPLVDPDDSWDSHDNVDNVLDGGGEEWIVDTGSLHNVNNVVHHDVHSAELRPHLNHHPEADALDDSGLEELSDGGSLILTLEADRFLDFLVLGKNLGVVWITSSMDIGKNAEALFPSILRSQPTW
jgi:hypothetical protein